MKTKMIAIVASMTQMLQFKLMDYLIVYLEILAICFIFTGIIYLSVAREMGSEREVVIFKAFLLSLMAALVIDGITHSQYREVLHLPPLVVGFLYASYMFIFSGVLSILWFYFAELRLGSPLIKDRKKLIIYLIPAIIISIMCFASIKTGWFFKIDEKGIYTRGPLWALQNIVAYSYFLFTTIHALIAARRANSPLQKRQYYTLALFVVAPFFGALLQLFIGSHPFVAPATVIAMLFIFINIQSNMIHNDSLTGLSNRKSAERYIEEMKSRVDQNNTFYIYIMDIDGFKGINDSLGHIEGDNALRTVANVLQRIADEHRGFVCRYGGDEFLAVIKTQFLEEPEALETICNDRLKKEVEILNLKYNLSLSVGYALCDSPHDNTQGIIKEADMMMYASKMSKNRT